MSKFKVGDKVTPISKHGKVEDLSNSVAWNEAKYKEQPFLFINKINKYFVCDSVVSGDGDYFEAQDLVLYEPKATKKQRIETLEKEVAELKLIVHELRERKSIFGTNIGQDLETEYAEQAAAEVEPSTDDYKVYDETIEFEGATYRKVEREARVGDLVMFSFKHEPIHDNNKPYKVKVDEKGGLYFTNNSGIASNVYTIFHGRTFKTVDVYELYKNKDGNRVVQGVTIQFPQDVQYQIAPCTAASKTNNELRAEIIEKAKAFVDEHSNGVDIVVNDKYQVVTAIYYDGKDVKKASALCHPNDVYNENLGKAIALGRALGVDVGEFEQAVQPTLAVGQIVQRFKTSTDKIMTVQMVSEKYNYSQIQFDPPRIFKESDGDRIINDTNANYSEVSE